MTYAGGSAGSGDVCPGRDGSPETAPGSTGVPGCGTRGAVDGGTGPDCGGEAGLDLDLRVGRRGTWWDGPWNRPTISTASTTTAPMPM
ncbi:hypothetical protein CAE01nite_23020 [Cellulomonas aerilata]|uniref:Uncharacterized protein n=1 Tax=Cellulomonas aerilata TaxID=515326 RepID=A0A512DDR1_9CELL|nr:hypothetical protein CAE01nite_23020 [Cellulomonas aerilata]